MKNYTVRLLIVGIACQLFGALMNDTHAAVIYWDPQGQTNYPTSQANSYSGNMSGVWTNKEWCLSGSGINGTANLFIWTNGDAACFGINVGTNTPPYSVAVSNAITFGGIFDGAAALTPRACTVTVYGPGSMTLAAGLDAFDENSGSDGSTASVTISNVMTGTGTVTMEGAGQLYLYGTNTYTGGTTLGYSGSTYAGVINFNNSASFGTGLIANTNGTGSALVLSGSAPVIIPNSVVMAQASATINFVGNPAGLTFSGPWSNLQTTTLGSGGASSNLVTLAGTVSGAGGLTKNNIGVIVLNGTNTYTGNTTISSGVLAIGPNGSINSSPIITVAAGAVFDVSSNTVYNLSAKNTVTGAGTVNGVLAVGSGSTTGGTITPGSPTAIGTLTNTGAILLQGGGTNVLNIQNAVSGAGVGNNLLVVGTDIGVLATSANPFVIKLASLTSSGAAGNITNFNGTTNYSWTVATGNVTNYTAGSIVVNTNSFSNSTIGGQFSVVNNGSSLAIVYQPSATPVISSQTPATNFTMAVGQSYTLSVSAGGFGPLFYQWYTNGVADTSAGLNANYSLSNVQLPLSGTTFVCVVSNANAMTTNNPVSVTVLTAPVNNFSSSVLSFKPVGYWPMHEVEAGAAGDIETNYGTLGGSGNGYYPDYQVNSGAFVRQLPGAITGDADTAVYFTAGTPGGGSATNSLIIPNTSQLTTLIPPFTLECWVFATNHTAPGTPEGDVLSQADGSKDQGFRLYDQNGTNTAGSPTFNYTALFYKAGASTQLNFNGGLTTNQWHHLVVTCDINSNVVTYTDGAISTPGSGSSSGSIAGKYVLETHQPLTVGNGLGNSRAERAIIDEVALYATNLSAGDINEHYNAGVSGGAGVYYQAVTNDRPLIYLRMDSTPYVIPPATTWPTLINYGSAFNNNGLYTPGTVPGAVQGPGLGDVSFAGLSGLPVPQFSGVSSFADAGFVSSYNPVGRTAFSISAMFQGNPADSRIQTIVGHSTNSWMITMNTTGTIQCQLGTNLTSIAVTTNTYNDGKWHQLMAVYMPGSTATTAGTNALYIDGVLSGITNAVSTNGINPGSTQDVMIGTDPSYTNTPVGLGRQFAGQVCEVALFTNALTSGQIQTLYTNTVGSAPSVGNAVTNTVNYGTQWSISILSLSNAAAWSDPNGYPLTLSSVSSTSAGGTNITTDGTYIYYNGVVTTNDSFNYVISDGVYTASGTVYLQATPAQGPSISAPTVTSDGHPTFSGNSIPGFILGVEYSTNLPGSWYEAGSTTVGTNGFWSFTDSNQVSPASIFYRLYYPDNPSNPPQ